MIGRSRQALAAAEKMVELVPEEMLRVPGMTFLQGHMTRHLQLKLRFSKWDDILRVEAPASDPLSRLSYRPSTSGSPNLFRLPGKLNRLHPNKPATLPGRAFRAP